MSFLEQPNPWFSPYFSCLPLLRREFCNKAFLSCRPCRVDSASEESNLYSQLVLLLNSVVWYNELQSKVGKGPVRGGYNTCVLFQEPILGVGWGSPKPQLLGRNEVFGLWSQKRCVRVWDFRVAFCLCFKASPSSKPFIWKLVLVTCKCWFIL